MCSGPAAVAGSGDLSMSALPEEESRKSKEELRELWRKAILQQIDPAAEDGAGEPETTG